MRKKVIISDSAASSFRRIIRRHKEVSLIGGEDAKDKVIQGLRRIGQNPMALSKEMKMGKLEGEFRLANIWDCQVLYKVGDQSVLIIDILLK